MGSITGMAMAMREGGRAMTRMRVTGLAVLLVAVWASIGLAQTSPSNGSKLISLDFKDADVINVLRILAVEGNRNLVVGDDIKGKVSVSLRNVTWDQALEAILEARGLQKIEKAGVIRIVSSEQLAKEREAQAKADEAKRKAEIEVRTKMAEAQVKEQEVQQRRLAAEAAAAEAMARGPLREEIIRLSYADAGEVGNTLQGVLGLGVQPILPCRILQGGQGTGVSGGGISSPVSGPIAAPPFSQLFGPPPPPEAPAPVPISPEVVANRLTIRTNCPTNSLFLRLYAANLERAKALIRDYLDVPLPQVKIEARMEILDRTALEAIGVQWGGGGAANTGKATFVGQGYGQPNTGGGIPPSNFSPTNPNLLSRGIGQLLPFNSLLPISPITGLPEGGNVVNLPIGALANAATALPTAGFAFGLVGSNFNINLALQALNELGKTQTLARPEIVTVENNKATIALGQEIPYATVSSAGTQIQFKEALLKLEVTPTVIRERIGGRESTKIKMIVLVENNNRADTISLGINVEVPAIDKRKAETLVLMNEGERLVIGGVTQAVNSNSTRKVPVFGDIPVLGWLFKSKGDNSIGREMVIFLTPSVLKHMVAGPAPGK
jgi:type IV pilus assembly protein PilQ